MHPIALLSIRRDVGSCSREYCVEEGGKLMPHEREPDRVKASDDTARRALAALATFIIAPADAAIVAKTVDGTILS